MNGPPIPPHIRTWEGPPCERCKATTWRRMAAYLGEGRSLALGVDTCARCLFQPGNQHQRPWEGGSWITRAARLEEFRNGGRPPEGEN